MSITYSNTTGTHTLRVALPNTATFIYRLLQANAAVLNVKDT